MHNPKKPNKNPKNPLSGATSRNTLVILILFSLFVGILILFAVSWKDQALNQYQKSKMDVQFLNGSRIVNMTSTVIVENYFPFSSPTIFTRVFERTLRAGTEEKWVEIRNDPEELTAKNITIKSIVVNLTYGNEEIRPPLKENNPDRFLNIKILGMSKATIIIDWSYEMNEPNAGEGWSNILLVFTDDRDQVTLYSGGEALPWVISGMFWRILSYLFFVASGFVFSWFAFREKESEKENKKKELYEAFSDLAKFNPEDNRNVKKSLPSLKKLIEFPNQIGGFKRIVFGLSILLFKTIINSKCKKHQERLDSYTKIIPHLKTALEKTLSKYSKQSFKEIPDLLPELKTIIIGIGFLASIGISFSWNFGAAAPFLMSLALLYFFLNIGSTFYFVGKSPTDRMWIIFILLLAIFVLALPTIISILRLVV